MKKFTIRQVEDALRSTFPDLDERFVVRYAELILPVLDTEPRMLKSRLHVDLGWTVKDAKAFSITIAGIALTM